MKYQHEISFHTNIPFTIVKDEFEFEIEIFATFVQSLNVIPNFKRNIWLLLADITRVSFKNILKIISEYILTSENI